MPESRTKKTLRNTAFSIIYQLLDVILNFVLRTIFIYTIGKTYLGLSGLFSNILTVLSMMDLGIGGAIVFCLYKPLADHDYCKVHALMQLYKRIYIIVGSAICVIGVSLTPVLKYIVNLPENVDNLYLIYWLSIAHTAVSYFCAYRRSLLIADQRTDINMKNQIIFRISRFVLLSISLIVFKDYILYVTLDVVNLLASNIHITLVTKKKYSMVESAPIVSISKEEKNSIVKYMSSGIFLKFGQTIVNCTDSIIISIFISTILVGLYSNYLMIISGLETAIFLIFSGVTASIGNYAVEKDDTQSEKLFEKITFGNFLITFYLTVCLISLFNPFISIWAGKDYLLSGITVIVLIINFYISTMQKSIECFMGANGAMFYHNRFRSLIEGIVNLAASLILVKYTSLGITGVFIGTTICFICGRLWMDAFVIYKHWFKKPYWIYVKRYALQCSLTLLAGVIGKLLSTLMFSYLGLNLLTWVFCGIVLTVFVILIIWLLFGNNEYYKFYKTLAFKLIKKRI